MMKRATTVAAAHPVKRARTTKAPAVKVPEYHLTASRRDEDGSIIWPAPKDNMNAARTFIREW